MTKAFYDHGAEQILSGAIDLSTDDIRVIGIDATDYTVALTTDQDLADVAAAARVVTWTLANESVTDGTFDADDNTETAVTGDGFDALVYYKHTGVEATSTLIMYDDEATGLPYTPDGGDIKLAFDSGANKIFTINP